MTQCYIPPDFAGHVKLYHSFAAGAARPEINLLQAKVLATEAGRTPSGLTGPGYGGPGPANKARGLQLSGLALPLNRPLTVSLWWRLDAPMKIDSAFALIALHTDTGYISNFVRGKGTWCGLTQPTYVVQVYRFPGISNVNGIGFGPGWADQGVWHHAAVTVSAGSRVSVYWDGKLRSRTLVKGRLFTSKDVVRSISPGNSWLRHPMTVDEVLVLDRALTDHEIADYVTAVRKLTEVEFPATQTAPL